jgi:hypothetical protein
VGLAMRAARPSSARRNPVFGNPDPEAINNGVRGHRVSSQGTS